jgi:ABC-type multidrug transport system fused ATPase/permease subunit
VVAHRLSTVREADRILCLHHGRLVEEGTHDELLRKGGLYARLCQLSYASLNGGGRI